MAVAVEGELDAGVSCEMLDVLWVGAAREQDSEAGVPEVVPAYVG